MVIGRTTYGSGRSVRAIHKKDRSNRSNKGRRMSLLWIFDGQPTRIHFQRPEKPYINPMTGEEDYVYIGYHHWLPGFGKGKGIFMECGGEECIPCAYANPQKFNLDIDPDLSLAKEDRAARPYVAVSGWVEERFHITDVKRKDGAGTFKMRVRCQGHGCEFCGKKDPKVYGKRSYFTFNTGQWLAVLNPIAEMASLYDKSGERLLIYEYTCPKCDEVLIVFVNHCPQCESEEVSVDLDDNEAICGSCKASWSVFPHENENIQDALRNEAKCSSCGHVDYPKPVYDFSNPDYEGEMDPYDLFDLQITVRKNDEKRLVVDNWEIRKPSQKLFDAKEQGNDETAEAIAKRYAEALDLAKVLEPDSPASQASFLKKSNPFGGTEEHRARTYSRKDDSSDDSEEKEGEGTEE